jgi:hypothetical protein
MPRSSHTFKVAVLIPDPLTPADIISALHIHSNCLTLQALTTGHKEIPTTNAAVLADPYFSPSADTSSIKTYEVTEGVIIIPGVGDWGKKFITFPANFQNTLSGLKTRADAPAGVVVRAEYNVQPGGADAEVDGEGQGIGYAEWVLVEVATVECAWWLMPFVKGSMEGAHRDICRKLVAKLMRQKRAQSGAGDDPEHGSSD